MSPRLTIMSVQAADINARLLLPCGQRPGLLPTGDQLQMPNAMKPPTTDRTYIYLCLLCLLFRVPFDNILNDSTRFRDGAGPKALLVGFDSDEVVAPIACGDLEADDSIGHPLFRKCGLCESGSRTKSEEIDAQRTFSRSAKRESQKAQASLGT